MNESITENNTQSVSGSFIILGTEFYYNAYCLGFEFLAIKSGNIEFSVIVNKIIYFLNKIF